MKKIKVGIPRALLYYRYGVLWKSFFEKLGCNVVLSPETNKQILELGINNTIDESCLSYKIYVGHVLYLSDICDYILISRVCDYGPKDKVCTRLNGTYDDIKNKISSDQILDLVNANALYEITRNKTIIIKYKINIGDALERKGFNTYKAKTTKVLSQDTLKKIKEESTNISLESLNRVCILLDMQPKDLIEYVDKEKLSKANDSYSLCFLLYTSKFIYNATPIPITPNIAVGIIFILIAMQMLVQKEEIVDLKNFFMLLLFAFTVSIDSFSVGIALGLSNSNLMVSSII